MILPPRLILPNTTICCWMGLPRTPEHRATNAERVNALFGDADELLFQGLLVDVAEMHIEELHAADLLELFFDPASGFEGIFQAPVYSILRVFFVWREFSCRSDGLAGPGRPISCVHPF